MSLIHFIGFLCNLVDEQTNLSSNRSFERLCDLSFSILHDFGISKKISFLSNTISIFGRKSGDSGFWILNQTHNLASGVIFEKRAL